jgi:hypothetical protein
VTVALIPGLRRTRPGQAARRPRQRFPGRSRKDSVAAPGETSIRSG